MITKGLLRKQVIIPMSNNNKIKFIEDSSAHIININKILKNIKFKVMVDFIQSNQADIIIATNKVTASLNLQNICHKLHSACISTTSEPIKREMN